MANLGYINIAQKVSAPLSFQIPYDESVGAFLFDLSGFEKPFEDYPTLYNNFKDNQIQCLRNMTDAEALGIADDGFLNGLLYYHLSQFFQFIGGSQVVYLAFADCSVNWDIIQYLQRQVNGKLFHIGVWTSQPIWKMNNDNEIGFTSLIPNLQAQADEINGRVGVSTHSMTPLNIVLCGNSNYISGAGIRYKQLPDALMLNCPKVSVILAQNGTEQVHNMQNSLPKQAPVSILGLVMGCLALCGAEESIASAAAKCNLNKLDTFRCPEWGFGEAKLPINLITRVWANIISSRGYIIPIEYAGNEASYYLSSDQTLCEGDYSSIANNRVMHKCRRAVGAALIPYVNSYHIYDPGTRNISNTAMSTITSSINTLLNSVMLNQTGQQQIKEHAVIFENSSDMLDSDVITIKLNIVPANSSNVISENISHSTT